MAFKSPGIYYKEIDNTEYTNPAAEINTTVAIIGFAKKGPIGEPIEITSYNSFKSIFGAPIAGTYAGLGVRSVLSAGGTVLFVRIADETLASKSNVIIKNGSKAVLPALIVNNNRKLVKNSNGYKEGEIYAGKLIATSGTNAREKRIYLRTPKGAFSISEMKNQLSKQLKDTAAFSEYSLIEPSSLSEGYKSFVIKTINTEGNETKTKPLFVNIDKTTYKEKESIISSLENTLKSGKTSHCVVLKNFTIKNEIDEALSFDIIVLDEEQEEKIQNITLEFSEIATAKNKVETIVKMFNETAKDETIIEALNNTTVQCLALKSKKSVEGSEEEIKKIDLVFFSPDGKEFTLRQSKNANTTTIYPIVKDVVEEVDTEIKQTKINALGAKKIGTIMVPENETDASYNEYAVSLPEGSEDYVLEQINDDGQEPTAIQHLAGSFFAYDLTFNNNNEIEGTIQGETISVNDFDFEYYSDSETFTIQDNNNVAEEIFIGEATSVDFGLTGEDDYEYDSITENLVGTGPEHVCKEERTVEKESNIEGISVDSTKKGQIIITSDNVSDTLSIEEIEGENNKLTDLFGNVITQKEFDDNGYRSGFEYCILKRDGESEIADEDMDMIVFTAKEYGSGTSTVGIEIYSVASPLDSSKTYYIDLYVDGLRKESWEDVSFDSTAENYFADVINADPDDGGSEYISVTVIAGKNKENTIIKVPMTSDITDDGIVYLGKPLNEESINFNSKKDIELTDFTEYDYNLGNDGIPDFENNRFAYDNLFINAMNTELSGLSNKDLYSWHILITPDDKQEQDIQDEAINLVEFMEDAIYIADPPRGLSREAVINWHNGKSEFRVSALESNHCCTYWPWLKVYNAIESKYQYVMPSIIMAAQFCRVDNNYAPWYAPAGETNGYCSTALDLEVNTKDKRYPNKADRDALYLDLNRINPFLKLKNGNILAYGEKTCQRKNSTLTKIHTRRMLIALRKDLNSVIKGFIFQPTMSENISTIRQNVTTVMDRYRTGGGIASYNVVCDDTNNTTETLQQDILNIAISCVPTGCIEQVEITFTLNKSAS